MTRFAVTILGLAALTAVVPPVGAVFLIFAAAYYSFKLICIAGGLYGLR